MLTEALAALSSTGGTAMISDGWEGMISAGWEGLKGRFAVIPGPIAGVSEAAQPVTQ